ncbi:MAG: hypothetical protein OHK0046_19600 [Anaerolineae bacterium]
MAENKTKPTDESVQAFLEAVENEKKREDCFTLLELMREVTGEEPTLWGKIVGFGKYQYKYTSGRTGEAMLTGFAPRKQELTLYILAGFEQYEDLLSRLGKHKTGKACLYIKSLKDVDLDVLKEMVQLSVEHMRATNPPLTDASSTPNAE